MAVASSDGDAGDEVVQHEVVEDDDAGSAAQRVEDPAVRVGVVANVVDGEVRFARRALRTALDDVDVDVLAERGQQQCRVVGDPTTPPAASARSRRPSREQPPDRAVPRHLVGDRLPRGPECGRLVGVIVEPRRRLADGGGGRVDDEPGPPVVDDVQRPARIASS